MWEVKAATDGLSVCCRQHDEGRAAHVERKRKLCEVLRSHLPEDMALLQFTVVRDGIAMINRL